MTTVKNERGSLLDLRFNQYERRLAESQYTKEVAKTGGQSRSSSR